MFLAKLVLAWTIYAVTLPILVCSLGQASCMRCMEDLLILTFQKKEFRIYYIPILTLAIVFSSK